MPLSYLNDRYGAQSGANTVSSLAYQLPQLRLAAERLRQQQVMDEAHRILYGAQAGEAQARTGYYNAQATEEARKTEAGRQATKGTVDAGAAIRELINAQRNPAQLGVITPSPAGIANALAPIANQQQQINDNLGRYAYGTTVGAGAYPERAQQAIHGTLADIVSGLASNPRLAAMVTTGTQLNPHSTPANAVSQDMYDPSQKTYGPMLIPAGGTYQQGPGQPQTFGQPHPDNQIPQPVYVDRKEADALSRFVGNPTVGILDPGEYSAGTNRIHTAFQGLRGTVPPSAQLPQGGMPSQGAPPSKVLDPDTARQYLQRAGGDKNKARFMAQQDGYTF